MARQSPNSFIDPQTFLFLVSIEAPELIRLFLEYGADVNTRNKDEKTALDLADESSNEEVKNVFKSYKAAQPR